MSGVQRVHLNNLNINIRNAVIIGIIIAKNSPRIINSKNKNGEPRGVTSITLRDSTVDTINADVWGSEFFILTLYERFLVGDVVEISSPKICLKSGSNEIYRPQVSSPFYLSLNEGVSDVCIHNGGEFSSYLPLLHIPSKPPSGYYGLGEILKMPEQSGDVCVDLLVVVKTVKPVKTIKTKTGTDMTVRSVEVTDNTTPASVFLDLFDLDTIQRAEEWRPLESVLFIADARVSWRRGARVAAGARSVLTHQPHTADAEALRLYTRNQASTPGGEAAAWAAWSGSRPAAASVAQVKDRLGGGAPFCASLHALLTHIDLQDLVGSDGSAPQEEIRIRLADHTGEISARVPFNVLETTLGYTLNQLKSMPSEELSALRWRLLLEQCSAKLAAAAAAAPLVLALQRASPADPIPLY